VAKKLEYLAKVVLESLPRPCEFRNRRSGEQVRIYVESGIDIDEAVECTCGIEITCNYAQDGADPRWTPKTDN
jgi:hypothetical protein